MEKKLPIFRLTINEDLESSQEVSAVALVDMPAIGENFFYFGKGFVAMETERQAFAVSEDERVIVGPAMIPDSPIYRRDPDGSEYYVVFDVPTINKIAQKFYAKGLQQSANEMHDPARAIEGLTFYQSWIADEKKGIPKMKQFEDLPDGTWFVGAKVNNEDAWNKVKSGEFKGFSVEGLFDMIPVKMRMTDEERLNQIMELLKEVE